jgi:hypothetical protein
MRSPQASDWPRVIAEYSSRKLTNPDDKLPALSSIAGYFAKHMNDKITHLAGLWATKLSEQLCWTCFSCSRPPFWRAPSRSFMSVDGEISFKGEGSIDFKREESRIFVNGFASSVISYDFLPISVKAPFGQVKSGFLKIRGRLIQTRISPSFSFKARSDGFGISGQHIPLVVTDSKKREFNQGVLHFDIGYNTNHGKLEPSATLWCLLVCMERQVVFPTRVTGRDGELRPYDTWLPWGLVLAKLPNPTYHRVG